MKSKLRTEVSDFMVTCPRCGWSNTRPSLHFGVIDALCRFSLLAPIRCRSCRIRFYHFALPGSKLYARRTF